MACILAEKACFPDWLEAKIVALQKENPGNEAKVMASLQEVVVGMWLAEGTFKVGGAMFANDEPVAWHCRQLPVMFTWS